jgi:hypothetical protein
VLWSRVENDYQIPQRERRLFLFFAWISLTNFLVFILLA